jgi:hypothetical protein
MLYPSLLKSALDARRGEFEAFELESGEEALGYARALRLLGGSGARDRLAGLLSRAGKETIPEALPSKEFEREQAVSIEFPNKWRSHEEARRWAVKVLQNRVTFAVDGSQLLPGREVSLPIAAIQIAWFENPHSPEIDYIKQAKAEVLSPGQLRDKDGQMNPEKHAAFHRTRLEIAKLAEFVRSKAGWRDRGERMPVGFFDGSFAYLISFPLPAADLHQEYANAVITLIKESQESEVPIVGFVDHSYARELVILVDAIEGRDRGGAKYPYNSQILRAETSTEPALLRAWGERTILFSFTGGTLGADQGRPLLGFCYLQTTADSLPARLDIPHWIYDAGLLDEVIDVVRAECVVGLGYPYAIETADEAAVITARDRQVFLKTFQEFAEGAGLRFEVSRKAMSKAHRR